MCKFIKVVVALLLIEERARLGIRRKEVMSVVKKHSKCPQNWRNGPEQLG
jgi:hypothetical protein